MLQHRIDIKTKKEDFDEQGQIKLSSLLYFCQEAAGRHAESLGMGADDLIKDNIVWVLTKMKIRILGNLEQDRDYYVMTYPRAPKSRFCPRDYYLYDSDGQLKVIGSAMWGLMDWTTRKLTRVNLDFGNDMREDEAFPEGFEKIRIRYAEKVGEYLVSSSDIDSNEHTNNCRYGDMASQASTINEIAEVVMQFSMETREKDIIALYREDIEGGQIVCGKLDDEQMVFTARITEKR